MGPGQGWSGPCSPPASRLPPKTCSWDRVTSQGRGRDRGGTRDALGPRPPAPLFPGSPRPAPASPSQRCRWQRSPFLPSRPVPVHAPRPLPLRLHLVGAPPVPLLPLKVQPRARIPESQASRTGCSLWGTDVDQPTHPRSADGKQGAASSHPLVCGMDSPPCLGPPWPPPLLTALADCLPFYPCCCPVSSPISSKPFPPRAERHPLRAGISGPVLLRGPLGGCRVTGCCGFPGEWHTLVLCSAQPIPLCLVALGHSYLVPKPSISSLSTLCSDSCE